MIGAEYFRTKFEVGVPPLDADVRVEVHLYSGAVFEIESVEEIDKGYVVLRVYSADDAQASVSRGRGGPAMRRRSPEVLDRLVVSYESIAGVHFARTPHASGRDVGF